jgi:hypothetical protein
MKLSQFVGDWVLGRTIDDGFGLQSGRFDGIARFVPSAAGLVYHEEGELHLLGGPTLRAERTYHWRSVGPRIFVDYSDGRSFHDFEPGDPNATHQCGADHYAVRYDFGDWPRWTSLWCVTGPRKDYRMMTTYQRSALAGFVTASNFLSKVETT